MPVLQALDAPAVRRWCALALDALVACQGEIDDLNVYPVPDRDTGTNLVLTLRAALASLVGLGDGASRATVEYPSAEDADTEVRAALAGMAHGAVLGARGNSGVIVSQFLRGLSDELRAAPLTAAADGLWFAAALARADRLARAAVARPVEGTALSVIRAAAAAACAGGIPPTHGLGPAETDPAVPVAGLAEVTAASAAAAVDALGRTPEQLPVLARAGVVDAGGRGVVVLLDTLAAVVAGRPVEPLTLPSPPTLSVVPMLPVVSVPVPTVDGSVDRPEAHPVRYGYEVQYLLDAAESDLPMLRDRLASLGESVAVAGTGSGQWNVHVHVEDIGAAIEAGIAIGRPSQITVTPLVALPPALPPSDTDTLEADRLPVVAVVDEAESAPTVGRGVAVVAVAPGEGISGLLEAEGVVVAGVGNGPVTVEQVRAAIAGTGAASVIVLPNHGEVTAIADAAARASRAAGQRVSVVPTRSAVQGLAAVAVHDETRWFDDDVIAMAEAAAATRFAEVELATREALTMAGRCQAGDVLGLAEGDVVLIRQSVEDAAGELLDRMLSTGGELVTIILGRGADPVLAEELTRRVAATHPAVEVQVYDGGQPDQPVILGVE